MSKPYLIMLPGWGMKRFVWQNICESLSLDFELIFIEWDGVDSLGAFKQKVVHVIEEKQLDGFSVLGWSLGALVAEELVADKLYQVNHLILIGGTSCFVQHKEEDYIIGWHTKVLERMQFQMTHKNPEETRLNFNNMMFSTSEKEQGYDKQFDLCMQGQFEDQSVDELILGLDYLIQKDLRNQLGNIQIPLLMIHGEEDRICPVQASLYIKNNVEHAQIVMIEQAGHIPFFTKPQACYNAITEFITKNA